MELVKDSPEAVIKVGTETIHLGPESLVVYQPRYADAAKTRIKAIVRRLDGSFAELEAAKDDQTAGLIRDVFAQYSEGEIEMFTHRENCVLEKLRVRNERQAEDRRIAADREETFQAKAKALALPQIRNHADPAIVRGIRRASSAFEVIALTVAALTNSPTKNSPPTGES